MKYLFDSSAIFSALLAGGAQPINNYTLDLARYELGNIIWKEFNLHKRLNNMQKEGLIRLVPRIMKDMTILNVEGREDEVLDVASRFKLSFYDASYVYCARKTGFALVTQDVKLINKTKGYIQAYKLTEI